MGAPRTGRGSDRLGSSAGPSRPLYSEFAQYYEVLFGEPDMACVDFVELAAPPPATLLDAGCGPGQYAAILAQRGYAVVACDREVHLLRAAGRRGAAASFVLADLRRLPFTARFDVVLARGVLNDLVEPEDLRETLGSVAASLRGEGVFIADVREREPHRLRIAAQPAVERSFGGIVFRALRSIDDDGVITSMERFKRAEVWSEPFIFRMRTFDEQSVQSRWRQAGLQVLTTQRSYGSTSALTDRLVVVAKRTER